MKHSSILSQQHWREDSRQLIFFAMYSFEIEIKINSKVTQAFRKLCSLGKKKSIYYFTSVLTTGCIFWQHLHINQSKCFLSVLKLHWLQSPCTSSKSQTQQLPHQDATVCLSKTQWEVKTESIYSVKAVTLKKMRLNWREAWNEIIKWLIFHSDCKNTQDTEPHPSQSSSGVFCCLFCFISPFIANSRPELQKLHDPVTEGSPLYYEDKLPLSCQWNEGMDERGINCSIQTQTGHDFLHVICIILSLEQTTKGAPKQRCIRRDKTCQWS